MLQELDVPLVKKVTLYTANHSLYYDVYKPFTQHTHTHTAEVVLEEERLWTVTVSCEEHAYIVHHTQTNNLYLTLSL